MKKKILVFIAVVALTLFAFIPPKTATVRADAATDFLVDNTVSMSFNLPFYYSFTSSPSSTTSFYAFHPYSLNFTLGYNTLNLSMYAANYDAAVTFGYINVFTYSGIPQANEINNTVYYLYCAQVDSNGVFNIATLVPYTFSYFYYNQNSPNTYSNFFSAAGSIYLTYETNGNFNIDILFKDGITFSRIAATRVLDSYQYYVNAVPLPNYTGVTYDFFYDFMDYYDEGLSTGINYGSQQGFSDGYDEGYSTGKSEGETIGYNSGYAKGFDDGTEIGEISFYSLISSLIDVPVNAFTNLFNFNILGINLLEFMTGLLTLALCLTIFRIIFR